MTIEEIKSYIDRILGNSIRCLLPSYWWKRAFGAIADKVGEVENKIPDTSHLATTEYTDNKVADVATDVNTIKEAIQVVRVYAPIGENGNLQNVVLTNYELMRNQDFYKRVANGEVVYADVYGGYDAGTYYTNTRFYTALKGTMGGNDVIIRIESNDRYVSFVRQISISSSGHADIWDVSLADVSYVDNAIANAITNTLNTAV